MSAPAPHPAAFFGEQIPAQWNRAFAARASESAADRRVLDGLRAVDATIRIDVEGEGVYFLNIEGGRMQAGAQPAHPPFLTLVQDRRAFERLAREAGDSALGMLGGLSGLAGEMAMTRDRIEALRAVDGLVRVEVEGEDGFALGAHFGSAPVPAQPKTEIRLDSDTYRELRSGALDPQTAFMTHRVRVDGDMGAAMQLALAAVAED